MSIYEKVYEIVQQIPSGRVLTYGVISHMIDTRLSAQGVGWALNALRTEDPSRPELVFTSQNVPWHRVINSRGGISTHKQLSIPPGEQRRLLEAEGIVFQDDETIILKDYLWRDT
jgi:methylated-DNA-protein-cysteine methyltransferase related protein